MNSKKSSGAGEILCLIGIVILFFVLQHFFPVLGTVLLVASGILAVLVILLVVLVIYFSKQKPEKNGSEKASADVNAVLSKGRSNIMELRRLEMRVKNPLVRNLGEDICQVAEKILRTLKEQPEDIPEVRQFLNYYLPTLGSILLKYIRVEDSGIPADAMTQNVISCLGNIKIAMEKQYANLFEDDMLDLSVEMEALTLACKRDGLLADESVSLQDGGRNISLTL